VHLDRGAGVEDRRPVDEGQVRGSGVAGVDGGVREVALPEFPGDRERFGRVDGAAELLVDLLLVEPEPGMTRVLEHVLDRLVLDDGDRSHPLVVRLAGAAHPRPVTAGSLGCVGEPAFPPGLVVDVRDRRADQGVYGRRRLRRGDDRSGQCCHATGSSLSEGAEPARRFVADTPGGRADQAARIADVSAVPATMPSGRVDTTPRIASTPRCATPSQDSENVLY
jgi:hypothetical protein